MYKSTHEGTDNRRCDIQDAVNSRVYQARGIASSYRSKLLERSETVALLRYQPAFAGHSILDVGVGTGRTAAYLAPLARRYVAIDYSPGMVEQVRETMPDIDVHLADMRDLSQWQPGSFEFVFATNNVLDAVSHVDRLRTLAELHRVMAPGSLLIFSSHNRSYRLACSGPRLQYSRNPVTQARNFGVYLKRTLNHARIADQRRFESQYALLDDIGHDYQLLHYYIDRRSQRQQLESAGFRLREVFDREGHSLREEEETEGNSSLLYVAFRTP
jgi:SAM-dependent methyltransferase